MPDFYIIAPKICEDQIRSSKQYNLLFLESITRYTKHLDVFGGPSLYSTLEEVHSAFRGRNMKHYYNNLIGKITLTEDQYIFYLNENQYKLATTAHIGQAILWACPLHMFSFSWDAQKNPSEMDELITKKIELYIFSNEFPFFSYHGSLYEKQMQRLRQSFADFLQKKLESDTRWEDLMQFIDDTKKLVADESFFRGGFLSRFFSIETYQESSNITYATETLLNNLDQYKKAIQKRIEEKEIRDAHTSMLTESTLEIHALFDSVPTYHTDDNAIEMLTYSNGSSDLTSSVVVPSEVHKSSDELYSPHPQSQEFVARM